MIEKAQLIAKVAEKHNILISAEDPIIAVMCMLDVFVENYGKSLEASLGRMKDEITTATFQAGQQAQQNAEKITIKSLAAFHKVIEDGGARIQGTVDAVLAEMNSQKAERAPAPWSGLLPVVAVSLGLSLLVNSLLVAKILWLSR